MRIRLFKPLHGWRAFLGEISIIVIGVLVALGAQQLVESWNWTRRVADAQRALQRESDTNAQYAVEMVSVAPCVDAQLDRLRRRLLASGATLDPAPVYRDDFATFVFRQPSRPYLDDSWNALADDGTAAHLDEWRRGRLARLYSQIPTVREMTAESDLGSGRMMLLGEAIPLDPGTRASLLQDIAGQRVRIRNREVVAAQTLAVIRDLGQLTDPGRLDRYIATQSGTANFCRAQKLPLADWRKQVAAEPILTREDKEAE